MITITAAVAKTLTTYVFLYPCECDAPFFTALTKAQQEGPRWFWTKQRPLSLLADESHDIPVEEQQRRSREF